MTQIKHTPAPWGYVGDCTHFMIECEHPMKGRNIATVYKGSETDKANARLIAAAPDYDAAAALAIKALENDDQVKHARQYELESECEKCRALDALYAAREKAGTIAKAEGKSC